jgi:hypothetical protein
MPVLGHGGAARTPGLCSLAGGRLAGVPAARYPQVAAAIGRRPAWRSIKKPTIEILSKFQAMPLLKAWA